MATGSSSGGGIVRSGPATGSDEDTMRTFRRRWASGVAIVTLVHDGGLRGVTVSGLMPLGIDPPSIALSLQGESQFQSWMVPDTRIGVSILDRQHEFLAERFAGRAPVPDLAFTGVPHRLVDDVPLIDKAMAWCVAEISGAQQIGDHMLIVANALRFEIPADSDEPLLVYDARYRSLEMS